MVRAGILAHDDYAISHLEVAECYTAFTYADTLGKRGATRLVAHVRAIREVVGAKLSGE